MSSVVIDYKGLEEAKSYALKVATGWGGMDSYRSEIGSSLYSPLDEGVLSGDEPYGRGYVESARQKIIDKQSDLETKSQVWINLSNNIDHFLQYLKDTEDNVVNIFSTTSSAYIDYSGVGGFFRQAGDWFFDTFAVDFANSNGFTRNIFDWSKSGADELMFCKQCADNWFRHGEGRYVLNIIGSAALTVGALIGVVIAVAGIPATEGTSLVIAVKCAGAVATGVSAIISSINTYWTVKENKKALDLEDDPAMARFHGNVARYSDYVKKKDYGSDELNQQAMKKAKALDTTQAVADVVSVGCSAATTFGTKSIQAADGVTRTKFDFNPSNVKTNVLNTFGFKVDKSKMVVDELSVVKTQTVANVDDVGDISINVVRASKETSYRATVFENAIEKIDGKKNVTRTLTLEQATASSEYGSLVASNGMTTEKIVAYKTYVNSSSTIIDYTLAASSTQRVNAIKAQANPNWVNNLTKVKNVADMTYNKTVSLGASDEVRSKMLVQNFAKKNYYLNQMDKYVYKYDGKKDEAYILGDFGKKSNRLWKVVTEE